MSRTPARKAKASLLFVTLLFVGAAVAVASPVPADDAGSVAPAESESVPPFVIENEWNGHITCGVGTIAVRWAACSTVEDPNDEFLHTFDVGTDIETFVVAVDWEPTSPVTGQELHVVLEEDGGTLGSPQIFSVTGPPPLEFRIDDLSVQDLQFRVFAAGEVAGAAVDQPFAVYYHEFYGEAAPEGYSALPQ